MFAPRINNIKALFIFHNDAHNHKITGILKQLKFRRSLRHVSVNAGTTIREPFFVLSFVLSLPCTAHPHNRLVCCHDIDHVTNDEDIEPQL
jgi:hypothetical protein